MAEVWYREKFKITIHHVNIKYLMHGIEWGVTPRTMIFFYFISLSINPVESIQSLADVEIVLVTVTIKIQFVFQ
jgi:hypothetical protein